jgi:surface carbohydrate biosynthesis protein
MRFHEGCDVRLVAGPECHPVIGRVSQRIVYLPCELRSRDFEPRLRIAGELLKRGFPVVFGQMWALHDNMPALPPGCVYFATANEFQARWMASARAAGHIVVATDEEALPFRGEAFLCNIASEAIKQLDLFLADTDERRAIMRRTYPDAAVALVGSARVDILRNAAHLRPLPQPYLLFNTNFALTNSLWGDREDARQMLIAGGNCDPDTPEGKEELSTRFEFEDETREQLMALIRWAASSGVLTVVRPHPAENAAAWAQIAEQYANLRIATGTPPLPWIAHAILTVHANSTTGLEAALMGKPCINLVPARFRKWTDRFIMSRVNHTVENAQQAADLIVSFLKTGKGISPVSARAPFLADGIRRTAQKIADLLVTAVPVDKGKLQWDRKLRHESSRRKFTFSIDELTSLLGSLDIGEVGYQELDDSVALLMPTAER